MKTAGINGLQDSDKNAANELFDLLEKYGIFGLRNGELESWLKNLGVPGKKTDWTIAMLERLGSDTNEASYVKPATDDVWEFMRRIVKWVRDPARQGTA